MGSVVLENIQNRVLGAKRLRRAAVGEVPPIGVQAAFDDFSLIRLR